MNLYDATVPVFDKFLGNIGNWLDKAQAFATERKFDADLLMQMRLAPDQFPLVRQISSACDTAKWAVAKMTGKEGPSHPDTEVTIADARARLQTMRDYLATYTREDFVGCEDRKCTHAWMQGKQLRAGDYLDHYALPNFHFHVVTAYGILRHNGVPLGKTDLLAPLPFVE